MSKYKYWEECVAEAANDCGLVLTKEQLECIAGAVEVSHDNYGMAFYSPPSSDIYDEIGRQHKEKIKRMEDEHRREIDRCKEDSEWRLRDVKRQLYRTQEQLQEIKRNR